MTGNLLEVSQATVQFGGVVALDHVDLTVKEGQTMAILGPNGAGKTTLFNVVAGVVPPSQGTIRLGGTDVTKATSSLRSANGIARTFQITQPFSGLTVIENVMVAIVSRGHSMSAAHEEAAEYVEFVGLGAKLNEPARTLSTGQRKRLELARALATKPRLLLLDEVTGGVDRPSIPQILDLIRRLREERGITVLVVEHNMEVLFGLADKAIFLNRGKVLVTGTMQEVAEHEAVRSIYLGDRDA
ncbi:ABC transporter ATP-binding protein [Sulfitobacter sp. 1A12779]|uniref:ABC transporter ATP-binding protein n=1 Tax=Sulfitobacter sp. 1A12779 TaxID=3368599 RepID=UPI0037468ADF